MIQHRGVYHLPHHVGREISFEVNSNLAIILSIAMLLLLLLSLSLCFILVSFSTEFLLHGRRLRTRHLPMQIAHRGGASERPENTLAAFENAVKVGAQMLELDVHLTRDGHVVVLHDEDLARVTGKQEKIQDLRLEDLPKLLRNLPPSVFDPEGKSVQFDQDCSIPTLREVFQRFPNVWVNIDVKSRERVPEIVDKVAELVAEFKRRHITVWGSFKESTAIIQRKRDPEFPQVRCTYKFLQTILSHKDPCFC